MGASGLAGRRAVGIASAAALTLLVGACGSSGPAGIPPGASLVPGADVDTLADEGSSGVVERRREVLRSDSAWSALWNQIHETRRPRPEVPPVDFGSRTVIAVAMGERPTGGHAVEIEGVFRDGSSLHVAVRETSPGESCLTTQAITRPVLAVSVPTVAGEVVFHEETAVDDC